MIITGLVFLIGTQISHIVNVELSDRICTPVVRRNDPRKCPHHPVIANVPLQNSFQSQSKEIKSESAINKTKSPIES